nr:MAG TPA: hypothetical protein [Caudoviricetes sp.]
MKNQKKVYDKEREREMDTIIGTAISLGAFGIAIIACAVALMKGGF